MPPDLNEFDPYAQWLGIPPDRRPLDHYRLLGLDKGESDIERIRTASLKHSAEVRRYCLGQHGHEATRLLGELAEAFACLSDPVAKAAYDRALRATDSGTSAAAPPVRCEVVPAAARTPPFDAKAGSRISKPRPRSVLGRRRAAASPAPVRVVFAASLVLGISGGALWWARHRSPVNLLPGTAVAHSTPATASSNKLSGNKPEVRPRADANPSDPPGDPPNSDNQEVRSPTFAGADTANLEPPAGAAPQPAMAEGSQAQTEVEVSPLQTAAPAANAEPPLPAEAAFAPNRRRTGPPPPLSVAQVTGPPTMMFQDPNQDFGKAWRSARRAQPEVLELRFQHSVRAWMLKVFETPLPAIIEEVVLYPDAGPAQHLRPLQLAFDAENQRARIWSLGANRPPIKRIEVTFLPTNEGFVEVDAVALVDRSEQFYFPVAARATSSAVADDPDVLAGEPAFASPAKSDADRHRHVDDPSQTPEDSADQIPVDERLKQAARKNYERLLAQRPDDETLIDELTQATLDLCSGWTTLRPSEMKSQGAATLKLLPDGSILAGGANPRKDVYTIAAELLSGALLAIRIEALPDASLYGGGPGRSASGNFVLTNVTVSLRDGSKNGRVLPLAAASADYSQPGYPVQQAIDDQSATGWAVYPRFGKSHEAVFRLVAPQSIEPPAQIVVTLAFESVWPQHQAGRFRLSVTERDCTLTPQYLRDAIGAGALRGNGALGAALFAYGDEKGAEERLARAAKHADCGPLEYFLLAIVQQRRGGRTQARESYNRGIAALEQRPANGVIQALGRQAAMEIVGLTPSQAEAAIAQAHEAAELAALSAAFKAMPAGPEFHQARGEHFAHRERWKEAAAEMRLRLRMAPNDDLAWLDLAVLLAAAGEHAEYREHCLEMLRRFSATQDPLIAEKTAKACSMAPETIDDFKAVRELARRGVTLGARSPWLPVLKLTEAITEYRTADYKTAREALNRVNAASLAPEYRALHCFLSALVDARLNLADPARQQYDAGCSLIALRRPASPSPGAFERDWLIAELFRREAMPLLEGLAPFEPGR